MKRIFLLILISLLLASFSKAQFSRYIVKFRDKGNSPYSLSNPSAFLSQRSVDRRVRYNLPVDSTDLPVTPAYISQVAAIPNITILNASKWLNQISIQTTDANAINSLNSLPYVKSVSGIAARTANLKTNKNREEENPGNINPNKIQTSTGDYFNYGTIPSDEIHLHHGEFLHNIGLRGQTMQIAMIDAGFLNYNSYKVFDSINANGQVLETWDFVATESSVAEDYSHGMSCLSTIAANIPGQFIGTAPKSGFYLYRSEDVNSEYPIEEHNWVCAAERADSAGADVISSSIGYTAFDNASLSHTYADLDGNTTMAAIGADYAAKKGLLIFIAAGNDGNNTWHYISTPADADSVLTVGAVNVKGIKGGFSSFGPTSDGRIKPDVVSVGVGAIIETASNYVGTSQGTSFACPKLAGLGTCLWQGFPGFSNMKILDVIRQSGTAANHPTDSTGYGIPDMKLAFTKLLTEFATSETVLNNCSATVKWTSKDVDAMKYEIERKTSADADYKKIGDINAQAGNILANHSYQFNNTFTDVHAGTISYRIKQVVDTSAENFTAVYIDTSAVLLTTDCAVTVPVVTNDKITVSPNPVYDELTLIIETATAIPSLLINIYDIQGRVMQQEKESKAEGKAVFTIPSYKLAKGKYTITVYDTQKRIGTVKIIKL